MNIKIECSCGTRYSFDVEPQNGRMPFPVNCPNCKADGTAAANQVIAQTAAAEAPRRLRVHKAEETSTPSPIQAEASEGAEMSAGQGDFCSRHPNKPAASHCAVCKKPICADCMTIFGHLCSVTCRYEAESRGMDVPVYKGQRHQVERRASRWTAVIILAILVMVVAALGMWIWYGLVGSKPRLAATLSLPGLPANTRMEFIGPKQLLVVNSAHALVHDFSSGKNLWSTFLTDTSLGNGAASDAMPPNLPQIYLDNDSIWICLGSDVKRLDRRTGAVKQTISIPGAFTSFTPAQSNLLVVSAPDETRRLITRIDLPSGEISRQEVSVPRSEKQLMPNELPPNVQPTAGVLLAQALDEQKFNKPLDAQSSQFFAAGQNLVELRVKLTQPKVTWIQTIKPRGPSVVNGAMTASTSASAVEEEVFNDIKRDRTGGVRGVDESRYEVRVRRWINSQAVEWQGVATGAPSFFSLQSVDLLTAGGLGGSGNQPAGSLRVFDKENKELFETSLAYPISGFFVSNSLAGMRPAVQTGDTLYFFDQGVLTAFALPGGQVRWRLPTVGTTGIQFDSRGMLYVDSTSASPEDIQFTDQIKFEHTAPVILKVDPKSGKILWRAIDRGQRCFLSGKFVYSESVRNGGMALTTALRGALDAPEGDHPVYFHLYRLDPDTGEVRWNLYREQAPEDAAFQQNSFVLRFGEDLKFYKYLTLE